MESSSSGQTAQLISAVGQERRREFFPNVLQFFLHSFLLAFIEKRTKNQPLSEERKQSFLYASGSFSSSTSKDFSLHTGNQNLNDMAFHRWPFIRSNQSTQEKVSSASLTSRIDPKICSPRYRETQSSLSRDKIERERGRQR